MRPAKNNDLSELARAMGKRGGSVKSEIKAKTSAANGKRGGRPKKIKQ